MNEQPTTTERLHELLSEYRETESQIAPHKARLETIREELSMIVANTGTVTLPGLGKLSLTAPAITRSYDTKALDAIVFDLLQSHPDIAQRIGSTEKKSSRSGSLRIESEKSK